MMEDSHSKDRLSKKIIIGRQQIFVLQTDTLVYAAIMVGHSTEHTPVLCK